jgi:RNA polymerase sigma-70 factor (family 1)
VEEKLINGKNEKQLVARLLNGSEEAFTELYHGYHKRIYFFALGYLKVREDAEEIVHDVFVQVWKTRTNLNQSLSFEGYICTIAKNMVYNLLKKRSYDQLYRDHVQLHVAPFSNETEEHIHYAELNRLTQEAISHLPARRKEVYQLCREEGLSHQEVAEKLGISINTVKDQMSKALEDIRQYLASNAQIQHGVLVVFFLVQQLF